MRAFRPHPCPLEAFPLERRLFQPTTVAARRRLRGKSRAPSVSSGREKHDAAPLFETIYIIVVPGARSKGARGPKDQRDSPLLAPGRAAAPLLSAGGLGPPDGVLLDPSFAHGCAMREKRVEKKTHRPDGLSPSAERSGRAARTQCVIFAELWHRPAGFLGFWLPRLLAPCFLGFLPYRRAIAFRNSSAGSVLSTSAGASQARRAIFTP